jgi:selenocysteine-specific elongation factor
MIIGMAGHVDHGKTALVGALTGVDTDRLKEEKARGISIDLGFAYLPTPDGKILGFVDVPGHERFLHNMLAGFVGIDLVLLVVACDDGPMPQTVEHLAIVDLLGIERAVVALTKIDLVPEARRRRAAGEVASLLKQTRLATADIFEVSSVTGEGVMALRDWLIACAREMGRRAGGGLFRLPIDRCFTLAGVGTVVTGTVLSGAVAVGDAVTISPSGLSARVRSIHAQNRPAARGEAGARCALNLVGGKVGKATVSRGDVVVSPALHAPTDRIDASMRVLGSEQRPLSQWMPVRLHHATVEVGARIALLEGALPPGGEGYVQLVLERPIAATAGDRFIVRDTSAQRTIGGGRFIDLRAPTRRRRTPQRRAQIEAHAVADPERALAALLDCEPFRVDLRIFARDRALAESELQKAMERIGVVQIAGEATTFGLSGAAWSRLTERALDALRRFHADQPQAPGMSIDALRRRIEPRWPAPEFSSVVHTLVREGKLVLDGANVRLPAHRVDLAPEDERLWLRIEPLLSGDAKFRPPRVGEIAADLSMAESNVRRLLKQLVRKGRVEEIIPDQFFLPDVVKEMAAIAVDIADGNADRTLTAAQFRDRLNNGRKVAIQILEYFDRRGITMRRGDLRKINPHRIEQLRRPSAVAATTSGRESSPVGRPDFKSAEGP